jgi:DNA-directed RNA polymerase specialized sigma subunit
MSTPFLPYPKEMLLQMQVMAERYLEKPTVKLEEQILVLLADAIRRHCDTVVTDICENEDLLQVARIACVNALRSYNPQKGAFYRWSRTCVYQEIGNYLRCEGVLIRLPRNLQGKAWIEIISLEQIRELAADDARWED